MSVFRVYSWILLARVKGASVAIVLGNYLSCLAFVPGSALLLYQVLFLELLWGFGYLDSATMHSNFFFYLFLLILLLCFLCCRISFHYVLFEIFMNLYIARMLTGEWNNVSHLWLSSYCRLELGRKKWKCYYREHALFYVLNNWYLIILTRLIIWFYFSTIHLALAVFFPRMHSQICNLSIIHHE
jgi:hypothetical protein